MTAFVPANLPSTVNTIEELVVWGASALAEINPNATVITAPGQAALVCNVQTTRLEQQVTNPERLAVLAYIPLAANWRSQGKIYSNGVLEISTSPLPVGYTNP